MTSNKIIRVVMLVSLAFTVSAFPVMAEDSKANNYGVDVFNRIAKHYPQHFSLRDIHGNVVRIDSVGPLGSHLIKMFSTPTEIGWIQWWGRKPVGANKEITSMCHIRKGGGSGGAEILFHKRVSEAGFPSEDFWRCLVLETYNAAAAGEFGEIQDLAKTNKLTQNQIAERMVRTEFESVTKAQQFQNQIWIPFCIKNNILVSSETWFFDGECTYLEWRSKIEKSKKGRSYLQSYGYQMGKANVTGSGPNNRH